MLVAQSNTLNAFARDRLAVEARQRARELMAEWSLSDAEVSAAASGSFDDEPNWSWRRKSEQRRITERATAHEVTLELNYRDSIGFGGRWSRSWRWLAKDKQRPVMGG
jgi:hypothetical protein